MVWWIGLARLTGGLEESGREFERVKVEGKWANKSVSTDFGL